MKQNSSTATDLVIIHDSELIHNEQSNSNGPTRNKAKSTGTARTTGPRTPQGKDRSKNNALKFGIFSKTVVLPGESQSEFNALLNGLRKDLGPVGTLEETLVEKVAGLWWRYRRFLIAEAAEIRAGMEFVTWEGIERNRQDAASLPMLTLNGGLIRWIANPEALQGCLDLLCEFAEEIEARGFSPEGDTFVLTKLYGRYDKDENWKKTLFYSYRNWHNTSICSEEERKQNGYASPQDCRKYFLEEIKEETESLQRYKKEHASVLAARLRLESLRRSVPEGPQLDRLLRYEAAISRDIERTLNQLERRQRMRLGQSVPPPINVSGTSAGD
jgi:hypothetical protein